MKLIYERIYDKLEKLGILYIIKNGNEHIKFKSEGFMDLNIDKLSNDKIAIAHNYIQNGDVMADPDMEIRIFPNSRIAEALTYQQDSLGIFTVVYPEPDKVNLKAKKELNDFLNIWLGNIIKQGFKQVEEK